MYKQRTYSLLTRRGYIPNQDFNIRKLPNGDFEVEWLIPNSDAPTQEALELEEKRDQKIEDVKNEALRRARKVYDTIRGLDDIRMVQDILQAAGADPASLTGRVLELKNLRAAGVAEIQKIRRLEGQELDDYDARTAW